MDIAQSNKFGDYYFNTRHTVYLDMDGVICDFNLQFQTLTNYECESPREYERIYGREIFVDIIKKGGVDFWSKMNWMPDGKLLWNFLEKYHPVILSKPIKDMEECYQGKELWVTNHLGPAIPFIFDEDKERYADDRAILIDDMSFNIEKFREAGGIGILHKDALKTIGILKERYGF